MSTQKTIQEKKPIPDFDEFLKVLRCEIPSRPVLFEFFMNGPLYQRLTGTSGDWPEDPLEQYKIIIGAFHSAGYDYTNCLVGFEFVKPDKHQEASLSLNDGSMITDWESFEQYQWPDLASCDYSLLERLKPELPDGMKLMNSCPGGVLENLISLTGFDKLCMMLFDDPELVRAIVDHIGSRLVEHCRRSCEYDSVGLFMSNDDWGFKSQPMLSPQLMREYIIPWHKKIVDTAHAAGRPAILHSCGNQAELYDDIIDTIGYDGKHSYEDTIEPVEDAYEKLNGRIGVLGGIDVDFLVRSTPEEITKRSEKMVERGMEKGGYALGSGNSIPEWVPEENYLAMIKAARRMG
ncbi:MAG: uroporphyrinogen decarboxylase family protein [Planctomycetota bacterium]|jgi:uroporphyrinogen decarboxylase